MNGCLPAGRQLVLVIGLAAALPGAGCLATTPGHEAASRIALQGGRPAGAGVTPLPKAHAHNDYLHARPLLDALDRGFCGVEADIFLAKGELLVGHTAEELRPERTLERLYLEPLRERVRRNGGQVYPGGPPFTLLIDLKSDAEATYAALRERLARSREMLTVYKDGKAQPGAVTVVVSGNRPRAVMEREPQRLAGLDGRLEDLGTGVSPALMPLVSNDWRRVFRWQGEGPMPAAERQRLGDLVRHAHREGYRLRFWGTADRPAVWRQLHGAGIDLINVDDLDGLRRFLTIRAS